MPRPLSTSPFLSPFTPQPQACRGPATGAYQQVEEEEREREERRPRHPPPSPPLGLGPLAGRAAPSLAQRRDRGCFLPTLSRLSLSLSFPRPPGLRRRRAPLFFYRASSEEHSWKKPATRTEKKKALSVSLSGFLIGSAKKGREIEAFYLLRKCFGTAGNWKGE